MSKNIAPITEGITAGQIGRASDRFSERCRTNVVHLPKDIVQLVLEEEGDLLAQEMFEMLRARVERRLKTIVRPGIVVDRTRTNEQAIEATGRKLYVNDGVVAGMPRGEGDKVDLHFFELDLSQRGGYISNKDLWEEYRIRGLKPDPRAQAAFNQANPEFADEKPNAVLWQDANGNWCYAAFYRCGVERCVIVGRGDGGWGGDWSFGGVLASIKKPSAT